MACVGPSVFFYSVLFIQATFYPGLCEPTTQGGLGFDYWVNLSIPEMWLWHLENVPEQEWSMNKVCMLSKYFCMPSFVWQDVLGIQGFSLCIIFLMEFHLDDYMPGQWFSKSPIIVSLHLLLLKYHISYPMTILDYAVTDYESTSKQQQ